MQAETVQSYLSNQYENYSYLLTFKKACQNIKNSFTVGYNI